MQNLHNPWVGGKRFDFSGKKTRLQLRRVVSGQLQTKPVPF
jgi:hypothetical protein